MKVFDWVRNVKMFIILVLWYETSSNRAGTDWRNYMMNRNSLPLIH